MTNGQNHRCVARALFAGSPAVKQLSEPAEMNEHMMRVCDPSRVWLGITKAELVLTLPFAEFSPQPRDSEPSKPPREAAERPSARSGLQLFSQTSREEDSVRSADITERASLPEHHLNLTLILNEIFGYLSSQW